MISGVVRVSRGARGGRGGFFRGGDRGGNRQIEIFVKLDG